MNFRNRKEKSYVGAERDQPQDEVRSADGSQIRLSKQRLRIARILSSKAKGLKRGDQVDLDYLPKMRLVIRLRNLTPW